MKIDIGIIIAVIGCLVGLFTYLRNKDKDSTNNGSVQATLKTDIEYIKDTLDNIRLDNREFSRQIGEHNNRIITLEEKIKVANDRIEKLEDKVNK